MLPEFPVKIHQRLIDNPKFRPVWQHPMARKLVLLWMPWHIVNQDFMQEALAIGKRISKLAPKDDAELRACFPSGLHPLTNFIRGDLERFIPDAFPYFYGVDVPFEVIEAAQKET